MKKIVFYIALAICAIGANAQEMTPEEVAKLKKEMNDIKRSDDFVFADGFVEYLSDDSEKAVTQSQQQSMMKLQAHVVKIFAEQLNMSKEDVQEIWDTIEDKCQNVEITASGVSRTFLYISKEVLAGIMPDINLFPNRKKKTEEQAAEFLAGTTTPTPTVQPEVAKVEPVQETEPVVAEVVEAKKEEQEVKVAAVEEKVVEESRSVEVQTQVVAQTQTIQTTQVSVVTQAVEETKQEVVPVQTEPVVVESPKEETPVKVETPAPAPAVVPVATKVEVPALCQTMLAKQNYETLLSYLNAERAYEKLIFGAERRMTRTAECYIVILDKNTRKIVTILDKGVTERMNFVTGKMDDFTNYQLAGGYSAIFVQEL